MSLTISFNAATGDYTLHGGGFSDLQAKGTILASGQAYPPCSRGDFYIVAQAGLIGGNAGVHLSVSDVLLALAACPSGSHAVVGSSWTVLTGDPLALSASTGTAGQGDQGPTGPAGPGMPAGAVVPFAGASAPSGWLLCYGQAVSQATYSALFAVIGTVYGDPGGGNFNLPDLRGRVVAGKDDMGGSAANRLTDALSMDGTVLGNVGGGQSNTQTEEQVASHTHTTLFTAAGVSGGTDFDALTGGGAGVSLDSDTGTGGSTAFGVVQPTIILNYIIKT